MTHSLFSVRALFALFIALLPLSSASAAVNAQAVQNTVESEGFRAFFVQSVHQELLGRAATGGEAAPLISQLEAGGKAWQTVIVTVVASPAYFQKAGGSNAKFVPLLFAAMVGRAPDPAEEAPAAIDFLKGGGSRAQLGEVLADTDEFRANWTQNMYQSLMGRAATEAEAMSGAAKLGAGGLSALGGLLLASPEYFQKAGGTQTGWQNAVNQTLMTGGAVLIEADAPAMPATPTAPPAMPAMNGGRAPMVQALMSSPEYASSLVQGIYQKFLRREATPAELGQWLGAVQGGAASEPVMLAVLTSDEYFNRAGGTTTGFMNRLSQDLLGKAGAGIGKKNLPSKGDLLDMLRDLPFGKKK